MKKNFLKKIQGDRKYFAIVFFILILLLISALITPDYIDKKKNNWAVELTKQIEEIELSANAKFELKMLSLIETTGRLKKCLRDVFVSADEPYREIIKVLNQRRFEGYSIGILAPNGRMIAWNNPVILTQENLFPLSSPLGELYFYETDLITYLSQTDTVLIDGDLFYLTISHPIEKKYQLNNKYFKPVSFIDELSVESGIEVEVLYNPFHSKSRDGKKYSFDLLNNAGNKIGMVTFYKPILTNEINLIKETSSKLQSLLVLLIIFFTALGMKFDYEQLKSRVVKILFLLLFFVLTRTIVFLIGFPSNFMSGALVDPSNFSSVFGWGIVKSPVEFLVTNLFVLLFAVQVYRHSRDYFLSENFVKFKFLLRVFSVFLVLVFLLLIRAVSASAKSVIFDSSIRYFKEPDIIPEFPALIMNLNILILTVSVLLAMLAVIFILCKAWNPIRYKNLKLKFIGLSFLLIGLSAIFFFIQKEPLITLFMMMLFVLIILILFYQIRFKNPSSVFNYIYITLAASIISIALLNYFNVKLERESLKTTAYEINRANENLLQFLLEELLRNASINEEIRSVFNRRFVNYDAVAFKLWSSSPIHRESFNSFVAFYDRNRERLGNFNIGISEEVKPFNFIKPYKIEEPIIQEINLSRNSDSKIFLGLLPFYEREILVGYLSVAVSFDLKSFGAANFPEFLESSHSILNKVVDIKQLKIFEITDNALKQVYGDRYPSREQIKEITSANFSEQNDSWLRLSFEDESYIAFLYKTLRGGKENITAVLVAEKQFSWNLFNFFKIFIIHSFFILLLILLFFFLRVKKINYTFKSKLLITFLIVSLIPVISLAVYNRQVVSSRGSDAIISELRQRAQYVENHIQYQRNKNPKRDINQIFDNAARELNISFSVYKATDEIYNSREIFKKIGLFDGKLNSQAHYHLNYLRFREFLVKEKIENYEYDALYRTINIDNVEYILTVNDAFNKIKISFSTVEIDVVIFGIYSFAVIIIIILSTIFANQIAYPIKRLTKAAESVGQGDLSVKIEHNEKGELKDLMDGFNAMTSELQKNQAELAELERESAWREMAKQVAHEIKNPLTPMKLAIQQLIIANKDKNKNFDSLFEKVSQTVLNQIENLNQIASEFSRFAKMPGLKLEEIDLVVVINDTINLYLDEKIKIDFKTELHSAMIEADKSHLRRVFINLIRNSIQAKANLVIIELTKIDSSYRILIKDNGIGIKGEDKSKIFDESYTTKKQGMGLGLAITRKFIESVNGTISLRSSLAGETIFEIIVPILKKENS